MTKQIDRDFDLLLGDQAEGPGYFSEKATYNITEQIFQRMEELGLSKSDLAQRLNTGKPYVTKILRGNTNFTLQSLEKIARALEFEGGLEVRLIKKSATHDMRRLDSHRNPKNGSRTQTTRNAIKMERRGSLKA